MISAVFFDLYGTLAGFSPSRYQIQSLACSRFGIQVTEEGILKGYSLADTYMAEQSAVLPLPDLDKEEQNEFFAEYERLVLQGAGVQVTNENALEIWRHVRRLPYDLSRFDDVIPAMKFLKEKSMTLGMISNMNRDGSELANRLGLASYLDFTITSFELGSAKPHPPVFLAALSKARANPHEALHIGDQLISDVQGAKRVGINAVLLDRDRIHRDFLDCPRIESLIDLPDLLENY